MASEILRLRNGSEWRSCCSKVVPREGKPLSSLVMKGVCCLSRKEGINMDETEVDVRAVRSEMNPLDAV